MTESNAQASERMRELAKHAQLGLAAAKTGMNRKTASKYLASPDAPEAPPST